MTRTVIKSRAKFRIILYIFIAFRFTSNCTMCNIYFLSGYKLQYTMFYLASVVVFENIVLKISRMISFSHREEKGYEIITIIALLIHPRSLSTTGKKTWKKIENKVKLLGLRAFDYSLELRVRWLSTRTLNTRDSKAGERGSPV